MGRIAMKTLLLMRHAKSSWKDSDIADKDRPLNKRGRNDASLMGSLLVERELVPQRILSSSALRASQTAELIIETIGKEVGLDMQVAFLDRLYMAESPDIYEVLRALPEDLERVMVIGHNPGLETLLQLLSNRIESLPTAVVAHLALPVDAWSALDQEVTGELVDIWRPKELREEEEQAEKEKAKAKEKEKAKGKAKDKDKEKDKGKKKSK